MSLRKDQSLDELARIGNFAHPEVLAEAYQTILRSKGYPNAYDALKSLSRGAKITLADLHAFVDDLDSNFINEEMRKRRNE
ncbi:hypothetical protein XH99_14075 [Bradyrhizobium nanningense]|uniref:Adenylosuccinate lyase PurB C-terminal domain-containing protein n=1 Tax=Bradyrhizobium nanningense TaxID=1325118 RepID=A0A4Q0S880_9BRAD|nr:hypothetical protein [Bradyrhizobium nanningense]RXH28934.1 hypothetical protein XH99_14075 [Bradyrhizobium nanningense]